MNLNERKEWHRALAFAAKAHDGQYRKDGKTPYIVHPVDVAARLKMAQAPFTAILAGLLHDTIEDTSVTKSDLENAFGPQLAAIVSDLTDDKSLPKAERKRLQLAEAGNRSYEARLVRVADKLSNLHDLAVATLDDWDEDRAREYVSWAYEVMNPSCGGEPDSVMNRLIDQAQDESSLFTHLQQS